MLPLANESAIITLNLQESVLRPMKNRENEKYVKAGVTAFLVLAAEVMFFFLVYRFDVIRAMFRGGWRILRPFVNGAVIAYLLSPLCSALEKFFLRRFGEKGGKWAKGLSILIALLAAVALVWLLVSMILPQLWTSIESIVRTYPQKQAAVEEWLRGFLNDRPDILSSLEGVIETLSEKLQQWMETKLLPAVQSWAIGLGSQVYGLLGALKDLLLGLLISAYMLAGRRRFAAQANLLLQAFFTDAQAENIRRELRFADRMFNGFLMGKLVDSAVIGVLCMVGVSIIGVGPAILVSTIVGVTNIIPFFGPFIGAIPCALLILLDSPLKCLYFILFIIALQQLDGNFIGPMILGDSTGLPGFWVMFAILVFGGIWGVFGMIIGVPLLAVLYDILRHLLYHRLQKTGQTDLLAAYDWDFHDHDAEVKKPRRLRLFRKKKK